ncbi:MAG: hypothetical protein COV47_01065 [Candidatus Diapherotrites archaeon CG11_big_fil_rev_8_21_14_0_20_37_9]|nr:MAG: hypothetical protein COV47_01065 [Candidatus Diapherotrites archaeon CG11_big_fil_rev_8_21_14_0_20_37_9]
MASEKQNLELRVGDKLNNILTSTKDYSLNFRAVQSMIVRSIMDDPRMAASKGEIVEMIAKIVAEKKFL